MAKVIIFSGAGISAESGISTFRDSGGLWEEYSVDEICTAGCLNWNYNETIEFYDKRREDIKDKLPNNAHRVFAELKNRYPNYIALITQNVDNLFEKAGAKDIIHLHGFLREVRCMECDEVYDIEYKKTNEYFNGKCPKCYSRLRPNVVFFGEMAPMYENLDKEIQDCEMFVVVGTSGNVINVNLYSNFISYSILNNLEPSNAIDDSGFSKVLYKKASEAASEIAEDIEKFLKGEKI
jgi:NAD-dependent deacetylase